MQVRYHKQFEKDIEKYGSPDKIREIFQFIELLEQATAVHDV